MAEKYGTIPKDFKGRMAYFWDYYKIHTIAVLFILVVLAVTLKQCADRPDPDYTVMFAINKTTPTGYITALQKELEAVGEDVNGNGKVEVQIIDVSVDPKGANPQMVQAQKTKLMAEMQIGTAILYITDEEQFDYFDSEVKLFQKLDFLNSKDKKAFNWANTDLEGKINTQDFFPENIYFSVRVVKGSTAEKEKGSGDREKAAKALLQKLSEKYPAKASDSAK